MHEDTGVYRHNLHSSSCLRGKFAGNEFGTGKRGPQKHMNAALICTLLIQAERLACRVLHKLGRPLQVGLPADELAELDALSLDEVIRATRSASTAAHKVTPNHNQVCLECRPEIWRYVISRFDAQASNISNAMTTRLRVQPLSRKLVGLFERASCRCCLPVQVATNHLQPTCRQRQHHGFMEFLEGGAQKRLGGSQLPLQTGVVT